MLSAVGGIASILAGVWGFLVFESYDGVRRDRFLKLPDSVRKRLGLQALEEPVLHVAPAAAYT